MKKADHIDPKLLQAHAEGKTVPLVGIMSHLKQCISCAERYVQFAFAPTKTTFTAPDEIWPRIQAKLKREGAVPAGWRVIISDSPEQALWLIESREIDIVLLGLRISDAARLQSLRQMKQKKNGVVTITTNAAAQPAVEAMKAGASDCLIKPFNLAQLRLTLDRLAGQLSTRTASRQVGEQMKSDGFGSMIGRSPSMEKLYRIVTKAAQCVHPVLIVGESGTGKELVAKAIHYTPGHSVTSHLFPSTAVHWFRLWSKANYLDTPKAHSPARHSRGRDCWPSPREGRYFLTKSENFRLTCKPNCSASCRRKKSVRSGERKQLRSMFGF